MNDSLLNDLQGGAVPKHYLPVSAASQSFSEDTPTDVSRDINAEVSSHAAHFCFYF
jgi:hypothetical protein